MTLSIRVCSIDEKTQDKGLGKISEITMIICGSQVWPGPMDSTEVT